MINKILTKNNKILANVFFQTLTNQAHFYACTALNTHIIELNIIPIIYNLITDTQRVKLLSVIETLLLIIIHQDFMVAP
jgi:hypothetical protein